MATAPRPPTRRPSRLVLVALCAAAAGCGGDDARSDTEQIAAAVDRVMESVRVEDLCEVGVSPRFVREVYGTLARCRQANAPAPGDPPPDSASISATRIDGDRATTGVTLTSVKGSRATGRVALVRTAQTWKVDRLGIDFLRSIFTTLPGEADTAAERRVLGCLAAATPGLTDADVRRIGHLIIGRRLTEAALPDVVSSCIRAGAAAPADATTA